MGLVMKNMSPGVVLLVSLSLVEFLMPDAARAQDAILEHRIEELERRNMQLERELREFREEFQFQIREARQAADEAKAAAETATETATETAAAAGGGPRLKMKGPSPTFESEDGRYSLSLSGYVHFDMAHYFQDENFDNNAGTGATPVAADLNSGTTFRRAYIGFKGKIAEDFGYSIGFEAGGAATSGDPVIDTANISYTGLDPIKLTIGKVWVPSNFEENTSSSSLNFLEHSIATNLGSGLID